MRRPGPSSLASSPRHHGHRSGPGRGRRRGSRAAEPVALRPTCRRPWRLHEDSLHLRDGAHDLDLTVDHLDRDQPRRGRPALLPRAVPARRRAPPRHPASCGKGDTGAAPAAGDASSARGGAAQLVVPLPGCPGLGGPAGGGDCNRARRLALAWSRRLRFRAIRRLPCTRLPPDAQEGELAANRAGSISSQRLREDRSASGVQSTSIWIRGRTLWAVASGGVGGRPSGGVRSWSRRTDWCSVWSGSGCGGIWKGQAAIW
jgi:hypothetical protein